MSLPSRISGPDPLRLRLIADVHGDSEALAAAVAGAGDRFIIQLGDLVDYGPDIPGAVRQMTGLVRRQAGMMLLGNHDRVLLRSLTDQPHNPYYPGLSVSLRQIDRASDSETLRAETIALLGAAPHWLSLGPLFLVHAAFRKIMLDHRDSSAMPPGSDSKSALGMSINGETTGARREDGLPIRTYTWTRRIPAGLTVVVGHDVRSRVRPQGHVNDDGGRVVFLDTGCGKGGVLSPMDVDVDRASGQVTFLGPSKIAWNDALPQPK